MELRVVKGRTSNNALKVDGVRTGWVACVVAAMAVARIKEFSVGGMMCAVRCAVVMGGEWVVVLCVGEWWYVADGGLTRRWWWWSW